MPLRFKHADIVGHAADIAIVQRAVLLVWQPGSRSLVGREGRHPALMGL
ncbi:hypothetical protein [Paraflavitalea speifideaquila]|nr:hypothetical protein [Paraflavitalea speifideiaquila]